ncbi:MAG: hypothetical protein KatS3mg077_2024 [Candidatus Binatia bacterium]|nr:MAG: hypothetical protein KatS3mg077_2024 [Candidatus Binatia bacterium]
MENRRSVGVVIGSLLIVCSIMADGAVGQGYSEGRGFAKLERVTGLTGEALEVILAAVPEAKRQRLVVEQSMIVLYDVGDYYVVEFSDRNRWADSEGRQRKESDLLKFGGSDILQVAVSKDSKRKPQAMRAWGAK